MNGHASPLFQSQQAFGRLLPKNSVLVSLPALSQIKPQTPPLVVPLRQFLQISALRLYYPRSPSTRFLLYRNHKNCANVGIVYC